jgi:hypothetical protein
VLSAAGTSTMNFGRGTTAPAIDFTQNPRLCNRISVLTQASGGIGGGLQSFTAYIPLKFIHDFFRVMDFPLINLGLRINFNIAGCGGFASYMPWTLPTFPACSTLGSVAVPVDTIGGAGSALAAALPTAVIGGAGTTVQQGLTDWQGSIHGVRLFLKSVQFDEETSTALKKKYMSEKGFTKRLTFSCSNYYFQSLPVNTKLIDFPITNGIIRPTRVWVFPLAQGTLSSATNTFPSRVGPNILTNTNLVLNGSNFYRMPFMTQYDFWREFKQQLIAAGSSQAASTPLSFTDFISGNAYYCFDLSRDRYVKSNLNCTLGLKSAILDQNTGAAPAGAIDLYVIVERLMVVTLKCTEGSVQVDVKQGGE